MWIGLYYDFIHYHITEEISLCNGMFKMIAKNYHTVNGQHIKQIKKKNKKQKKKLQDFYFPLPICAHIINLI